MSKQDISEALQHPRRSLGDRHRSQSEKYVSLALDGNGELIPERAVNLEWGEQSARQAVLYDLDTNSIIFKKNSDQLVSPSSMSKIMTIYYVFKKFTIFNSR